MYTQILCIDQYSYNCHVMLHMLPYIGIRRMESSLIVENAEPQKCACPLFFQNKTRNSSIKPKFTGLRCNVFLIDCAPNDQYLLPNINHDSIHLLFDLLYNFPFPMKRPRKSWVYCKTIWPHGEVSNSKIFYFQTQHGITIRQEVRKPNFYDFIFTIIYCRTQAIILEPLRSRAPEYGSCHDIYFNISCKHVR